MSVVFDSQGPSLHNHAAARQSGIDMLCAHRLPHWEAAVRSLRGTVATYGPDQDAPLRPTLPAKLVLNGQLPTKAPQPPICRRLVLGFLLFIKSCPRELCSLLVATPDLVAALLHQPQPLPFDFADKYLGQGRPFSNPAFSANDLSFSSRRPQSNLTSGTSGVALPANPSLDFNGNSLLSETP
ncbi:hypothetical protein G647_09692 [Cladophialophora carrionii CBS 160.54]|uniref:Uncharacterized protein n=1 Tax=Cladophialophora carrionii CBS 160.54 TaxID=1279043 RepID=V9DLH3_9EURO|nr:uncharacterized protein G647_09692 [Cladophialophora carrionii CBS 160.54]ETI27501.1 hypothetical protein G647_09692 [Cladophialophora carrionii CBS 160.54]